MAASRQASVLRLDRPTRRERERLQRDGFVVLPGVLDDCDFAPVHRVVSGVNRHPERLPAWARQDLGSGGHHLPQVNALTRLYPSLRRTEIVRRLGEVADAWFGAPSTLRFDFSITKPPGATAEVPWHQDRAYHPEGDRTERLHVWIPLQDTSAVMGCMEYLPGSHLRGEAPHRAAADSHGYALELDPAPGSPAVACETRRGDVILHTSLTWHRTGPNRSNTERGMWALEFERADQAPSATPSATRLRKAAEVLAYRLRSARG